MDFFKNIVLSLKTKKLLDKKDSFSFDFSNISNVCIFLDFDYSFINEIKSFFSVKNIKCFFITNEYSKREGKIFDNSMGYDYTKKDFKITGGLDSSFMSFLENKQYDLFIGLINIENIEKKYIVSKVKARLKLGINTNNYYVYDVVINNSNGGLSKYFLEETFNYLKNIKR